MSIQTQLESITKQITGFHRNVYAAFICIFFFGFLVFGGAFQVLVNLFLIRLGFGPEFVGLLNGLGLLFISIGAVLGAILGHRFSSVTVMRAGYFVFFIGMLIFPLAPYLPKAAQQGWLLATYSVGLLMAAIYVVHINPLIMASTHDAERNRVFSYIAALTTIGGFIGSWFAGSVSSVLIDRFSMSADSPTPYTWTLLIAAALSVLGVIGSLSLNDTKPEEIQESESNTDKAAQTQDTFPWKIILIIAAVITLRIVGELSVRSFSNLFLDLEFDIDPARIAYIFSIAQLLSIPAPLISPLLMTRFGRGAVFNWATIGLAIAVIFIAFAQHWLWIAVGYFLVLALAQIARPAIAIITMSVVTPKWQSSMSGSNMIAIGLSGLGSSLMAGFMIGSVGFQVFFLTAAAITLAGVAVFWFNFMKDEDRPLTIKKSAPTLTEENV